MMGPALGPPLYYKGYDMPWTSGDADEHVKGLTDSQAKIWASTANAALARCEKDGGSDCEGRALAIAAARVKQLGVAKINEEKRLVFGWAYVCKRSDGEQVIDHSGEFIESMADVEDAVYEFVLDSRETDDMHTEDVTGHLVESVVFTKEKMAAMGIPEGTVPEGIWVGFKLDEEAFAKVRSGERAAFSIFGTAERVAA
jgi:hypothetical protein